MVCFIKAEGLRIIWKTINRYITQHHRLRLLLNYFVYIVTYWGCDYRRGLEWMIGFIAHFITRLGSTSNYSAIINLHNSQFITAPAKQFPACCVFTSRSPAKAENSSASRPQVLPLPTLVLPAIPSTELDRHLFSASLAELNCPQHILTGFESSRVLCFDQSILE
jgi:hypothetical protein